MPDAEPTRFANVPVFVAASRRLSMPVSSVALRLAMKFTTSSPLMKSRSVELVARPISPTVDVNVSSICWRIVLAPLSVTRGAMAFAFWFS